MSKRDEAWAWKVADAVTRIVRATLEEQRRRRECPRDYDAQSEAAGYVTEAEGVLASALLEGEPSRSAFDE
jgi:hypothetical protein